MGINPSEVNLDIIQAMPQAENTAQAPSVDAVVNPEAVNIFEEEQAIQIMHQATKDIDIFKQENTLEALMQLNNQNEAINIINSANEIPYIDAAAAQIPDVVINMPLEVAVQNDQTVNDNMQLQNTQDTQVLQQEAIKTAEIQETIPTENTESVNENKTEELIDMSGISFGAIPNDLGQKVDQKLGLGFCAKLTQVSNALNCDAMDLLTVLYAESKLNPQCGQGGGAKGLNQLTGAGISSLNKYGGEIFRNVCAKYGFGNTISRSQVTKVSAIDQLDIIQEYFKVSIEHNNNNLTFGQKLDAATLFALNLGPGNAGREMIYPKNSWGYSGNAGLDRDNNGITKSDLAKHMEIKKAEMFSILL